MPFSKEAWPHSFVSHSRIYQVIFIIKLPGITIPVYIIGDALTYFRVSA